MKSGKAMNTTKAIRTKQAMVTNSKSPKSPKPGGSAGDKGVLRGKGY